MEHFILQNLITCTINIRHKYNRNTFIACFLIIIVIFDCIKRRYLILLSLMQNDVMTLVNIKFLILIEIRLFLES